MGDDDDFSGPPIICAHVCIIIICLATGSGLKPHILKHVLSIYCLAGAAAPNQGGPSSHSSLIQGYFRFLS